jgi:hypothetical protein
LYGFNTNTTVYTVQCTPKASEDVVGVAMEEPVETYETYPVEISWAQDGSIVFLLQEN